MAHGEDERKALGASLAAARKNADLTIEQAARALTSRGHPISKQGVGHWEKGRNVPDALRLRHLAALYGVSLDVLVGKSESAWPFTSDLHDAVMKLDAEAIGRIENAMRALLGIPSTTPRAASNSSGKSSSSRVGASKRLA